MAKNKRIVKNNGYLRWELSKNNESINEKIDQLVPVAEGMAKKDISMANKTRMALDTILKTVAPQTYSIINNVSERNVQTLTNNDIEHKAKHYLFQGEAPAKGNLAPEVETNPVLQAFKSFENSFFKTITTASNQTPEELQKQNIKRLEQFNYSRNLSKANGTYLSDESAYEKMKSGASLIAFDLETYGGTRRDGIWSPEGITEFSFQKYTGGFNADIAGDNINKYLEKNTAIMGISQSQYDDLSRRIKHALDNKSIENDEFLKITAKRFQMYGMAKAENIAGKNGLMTITSFPEEGAALRGGYSWDKIKQGLDLLRQAGKHAETNSINGVRADHYEFFNQIAKTKQLIENNKAVLAGFNSAMFDLPITNAQLHNIYKNSNEAQQQTLAGLFGGINNMHITPNTGQALDVMSPLKMATAISGPDTLFGKNASAILSDVNIKRINRQEHIFAAALPNEVATGGAAHVAENDVTALIRLMVQKSDVLNNKSVLTHAMDENAGYYKNGTNALTIAQENFGKHIFKFNGVGNPTQGRGVLNFTVDNQDGSIKTRAGIKLGAKDAYSEAMGGAIKVNYSLGAGLKKNMFYEVGDLIQMDINESMRNQLLETAPEYATGNLTVLRLDPVLNEKHKKTALNQSQYLVFNDITQLEATMSNLQLVASKTDDKYYYDLFDDNSIDAIKPVIKDKDGKYSIPKNKAYENGKISKKDFSSVLYTNGEAVLKERANAHFNDKTAKRVDDFTNFMAALREEAPDLSESKMKELAKEKLHNLSREVSESIAKNEPINKTNLDIINALGFDDFARKTAPKQLLTNTINNYIYNFDKLSDMQSGFMSLRNAMKVDNSGKPISGKLANAQFKEALELGLDTYLTEQFGSNYMNLNYEDYKNVLSDKELKKLRNNISTTKADLANRFDIDIKGFRNSAHDAAKVYSYNNNYEDLDILSVNLNNPHDYINKITKQYFGDKDGNKAQQESIAVIKSIEHLYQQDKSLFKNNETLKSLYSNIQQDLTVGMTRQNVNAIGATEQLLRGLKEVKSNDVNFGIKKSFERALDLPDFLNNKTIRDGFNEFLQKDNIAKNLIASTNYSTVDINKNYKQAVSEIVNNFYMPHFNVDGKKLTGENAFNHILKNGNINTQEADILRANWNKTRSAHEEIVSTIFEVGKKTGSTGLDFDMTNGNLTLRYANNEAVHYDSLARTKFKYGSMYHEIGTSAIKAEMKVKYSGINDANPYNSSNLKLHLASNLEELYPDLYKGSRSLEAAKRRGDLDLGDLLLFKARVTNGMRNNGSVIQEFNVHELNGHNTLAMGAVGEILPALFGDGSKERPGALAGLLTHNPELHNLLIEDVRNRERQSANSPHRRGRYFDALSPQSKEIFAKDIVPILLESDLVQDDDLRNILNYANYSIKNTSVVKDNWYLHLGKEGYTQRPHDMFDNAQRPTLQAGKRDYRAKDLKSGVEEYRNMTGNHGQFGSVFTHKFDKNIVDEDAVGQVANGITIKKANVGSVGLKVLLESKAKEVMDNNKEKVSDNLDHINDVITMNKRIMHTTNLYEQEKIMDARLMDATFQQSANVQFISNRKADAMYDLYSNKDNTLSKAERKVVNRIGDVTMGFAFDGNGLKVNLKDGRLVDRGDTVLSYLGHGDRATDINSKIFKGRFNQGVFTQKGNIKLTQSEIQDYLNQNINQIDLSNKDNIEKNVMDFLKQNFNVKYYVEDIRQGDYVKFMNEGVEKDMTLALYGKLGQHNAKVKSFLENSGFNYQGKSGKYFLNQVLKVDEIDNIFKNANFGNYFKNFKEFKSAVLEERYMDSKYLFDEVMGGGVGLLANHQVGKHNNQGMMADNMMGLMLTKNIDNIRKANPNMTYEEATQQAYGKLHKELVDSNVIKDMNYTVSNGTIVYDAQRGRSAKDLKGINTFNLETDNIDEVMKEVNTLNLGNLQSLIKNNKDYSDLYHKNVNIINKDGSVKTVNEMFGELRFANVSLEDGTSVVTPVASFGYSELKQAQDSEYMTVYDYKTKNALDDLRRADVAKVQAEVKYNKAFNRIAQEHPEYTPDEISAAALKEVDSDIKSYNALRSTAQSSLSNLDEISKPKKIGSQEMAMYDLQKWNYSSENVVNDFFARNASDEDMQIRQHLKDNVLAKVFNAQDNELRLKDEYKGTGVYDDYLKSLRLNKIFKTGDVALDEDILSLPQYKHLSPIYNKVKAYATEQFGEENSKVSLRYAENIHQLQSAHNANKFNSGVANDIEVMKNLGFDIRVFNNPEAVGLDKDKVLSTMGASRQLNMDTMFDSNTLLYLDYKGKGIADPDSFLAIPKAGQLIGDVEVKKKFQSNVVSLNNTINRLDSGELIIGSDEHKRATARADELVNIIKDDIRSYAYDKGEVIHDASKVELDEAFRMKFSFTNNADKIDISAQGYKESMESFKGILKDKSMSIMDDDSALSKATMYGKSIRELENAGINLKYAFVDDTVFREMGYFENDVMKQYGASDEKQMKKILSTTGITGHLGRYPTIMEDSDSLTTIFLDEKGANANRMRVSVAAALSMNADNDGDSGSFGLIRSKSGTTMLDYQMAKAKGQDALDTMNKDDVKFFAGLEAHSLVQGMGINQYYENKSIKDMKKELGAAIDNGTIGNHLESLELDHLFKGMLYANSRETNLTKKEISISDKKVDELLQLGQRLNGDLAQGLSLEDIKSNDEKMSAILNNHLKALSTSSKDQLSSAMTSMYGEDVNVDDKLEMLRQHALIRVKYNDMFQEAQSKARMSSVGPVNAGLQGLRSAGRVMYADSATNDKSYLAQQVLDHTAYEIEQQVISSKKGSIVDKVTIAKELNEATNAVINGNRIDNDGARGTAKLTNWLQSNLSNDNAESIWSKLESAGKVNFEMLGGSKDVSGKKDFIINNYVESVQRIGSTSSYKAAYDVAKIGGSSATQDNVRYGGNVTTADDIMAVLNPKSYENAQQELANRQGMEDLVGTAMNSMAHKTGGSAFGKSMSGKGVLATLAVGIGAGILASGYAGNPLSQINASQEAQDEELRSDSNAISFMDQGANVTKSSNRGYIINIKANTNKDLKSTKRALRQAASASVGGGVNVNMTIKDNSQGYRDEDLQQMISGLF